MNLILFISLLFGLQIFYWLVGKRATKNLKSNDDYFLAGKSVRFFPLMMTFLATQVGGGLVLGAADEAYRFGWPVLLYPLGASLGLILLGMGFGKKLAQFQVSTVAQILEVVYRSPMLKKVASLLSVISLFMILVAQIIASNRFLVSLGIQNTLLFALFWAIVILYTVRGGLKAVIATDIVQAAFFSVVFLLCFGFVFYTQSSSLSQPLLLENFAQSSSKMCGWLLMPLLFMIIEQDMGQRCFAAGSERIVSKASLWSGIVTMVICFVPIFLGVLAKSMNLAIPEGASVLMTVIEKVTNPWTTAIVGCAVLAAIISTASSLINAISSNLSNDFIPLSATNLDLGPRESSRDSTIVNGSISLILTRLRSSNPEALARSKFQVCGRKWYKLPFIKTANPIPVFQAITAVISIGALFFAFYFNNVVDILIQSYELSVSCLFVPIVAALFKREGNFVSALLSILLGALGFLLFRVYPIPFPKEIASILLSSAGYLIGELLSRRRVYEN